MFVTRHHRLARTKQRLSPNRDPRPDPEDVCLIVIHGISLPPGEFGTSMVEALFLNSVTYENERIDAFMNNLEKK